MNARKELNLSIHDESKLFKVGLAGSDCHPASGYRPRRSYKKKKGMKVVNKRELKTCQICHRQVKQLPRHIKSVHGHMDKSIRLKALALSRPYDRKEVAAGSSLCPICDRKRSNLSAHLLRVHGVSKKHKELQQEGVGKKIETTISIAVGKYASIEESLEHYGRDYFTNLDGAHKSLKPESDLRYKKRKLASIRKALYWLADETGHTSLVNLLSEVRCLGKLESGYYESQKKVDSDKGKALRFIDKSHLLTIFFLQFFSKRWSRLSLFRCGVSFGVHPVPEKRGPGGQGCPDAGRTELR